MSAALIVLTTPSVWGTALLLLADGLVVAAALARLDRRRGRR